MASLPKVPGVTMHSLLLELLSEEAATLPPLPGATPVTLGLVNPAVPNDMLLLPEVCFLISGLLVALASGG